MKISRKILPVCTMLAVAGSAGAAENAGEWYFSPMLSYIASDDDRQADNDFGLMLGFGKEVSENWNLEVSAAIDDLDFEAINGEYKQRGLIIDGLYMFDRDAEMQTYAVLGAGVMSTDVGAADSTNPLLNIGVGMMKQISDNGIKLRADVRYRLDMDDESIPGEDEFSDLMLNIGLAIPFGNESKTAAVTKAQPVVEKDSDNDGIMDSADRCPGSASGANVDEKGCVIVVEKAEAKAPEQDSDNDGVVDSKDNCPSSKPAVNVDTKGCELQQSFVLEGVTFVTGSDALTGNSKDILNDVAATLIKNSAINVEVAGYTDDRGRADANQRLSQKRAESVKAYLVKAGVDATRMTAKGYGEDSPVADNGSAEGRSQNRRVELHIIR